MGRKSCKVEDYYPEQVRQLLQRVQIEWPEDWTICLVGFGETMKWMSRLLDERVAGLYDCCETYVGYDIAQREVQPLEALGAFEEKMGLLICHESLALIEEAMRVIIQDATLSRLPLIWNTSRAYEPCLDEPWARSIINSARLRGESVNSPDRIFNLMQCVRETHDIKGGIIECGCFAGGTAAVIWETLQAMEDHRSLYMYDSFRGFPPHELGADARWNGTFSNVSLAEVCANFADCERVAIIDGNMIDTITDFSESLSFAHIDVDSYETVAAVTPTIWDCLSPGGILLFDDYGFLPNCLPLKIFVDDFFRAQPAVFRFFLPSNGYLVRKEG